MWFHIAEERSTRFEVPLTARPIALFKSNRLKFTAFAVSPSNKSTRCRVAPRKLQVRSRLSLQHYLVEAVTELLGQIQRLFIRTRERVY